MGIYLNPGNAAFQLAVNNAVYVDKSGLIRFTNDRIGQRDRFICVSRPRRFGKSMAAEMLAAYYDKECDSSGIFQNLEIARYPGYADHLNRHDVIFINVQKQSESGGEQPSGRAGGDFCLIAGRRQGVHFYCRRMGLYFPYCEKR